MFSAWCHKKRNIKKTEKWVSGRCGVMLDTVTPSAPTVWVSPDCTTWTQFPSQVGCRLWGYCGPPPGLLYEQREYAKRGLTAQPGTGAFLSLCEVSNTRGANPNKSIMEHMPRSIFGEALDTKSPELFGRLLTKRRRDGAGEKAKPQGLQGLGCECSAPQPTEACGILCPPPWPAAPPCPPRAASAALRGRECVGSSTTPRRAVC